MREYFRDIYLTVRTILIGMRLTLKYCFGKTITVQYPDVAPVLQPRFRGIHRFEIEKCIGCDMCAKACPVDCIHPTKDEPEFEAAEMLYIEPDECIDCGACVPACPVEACFEESELPEKWHEYIAKNAEYYSK